MALFDITINRWNPPGASYKKPPIKRRLEAENIIKAIETARKLYKVDYERGDRISASYVTNLPKGHAYK